MGKSLRRVGRRELRALLFVTVAASVVVASATASTAPTSDKAGSATQVKIAVFLATAANTWWQAHLSGVKDIAKANNATVTVFDGAYDPNKQYNQIQDAVTSKRFDAFIIGSIDGGGLVPVAKQAIGAGVKVASFGTALGSDLRSAKPQLPGQVGAELLSAQSDGLWGGKLIVRACGSLNPCKVAYIMGTRKSAWDATRRQATLAVVKKSPRIKIVAEGEGGFLPAPALKVAQDILQAHPDLNVIATSGDQMTIGVQQAVEGLKRQAQVKLVGEGTCATGYRAVKAKKWVGSTVSLPRTGGRAAARMVINAVLGKPIGKRGIDDASQSMIGPILTQANVNRFKPEWEC